MLLKYDQENFHCLLVLQEHHAYHHLLINTEEVRSWSASCGVDKHSINCCCRGGSIGAAGTAMAAPLFS